MPLLRFRCPGCNRAIQLDSIHGGKQAQCPKCSTVFRAPVAPTAEDWSAWPSRAVAGRSEPERVPADPRPASTPASPEPKKRSGQLGCLMIFGLLLILFLLLRNGGDGAGGGGSGGSVGGETLLSAEREEVVVAVDKDAFDRFIQLSVANDTQGLAQMTLRGRLFLVPNRTKVRVIDRGFGWREVRIVDGPQTGRSGFVTKESVQ